MLSGLNVHMLKISLHSAALEQQHCFEGGNTEYKYNYR